MTEDKREIMELLLANRFYLYSLLHKCFGREPDRKQLELLAGEQTGQSFALLGGEVLKKVPAFLGELREDLKDPDFPEQAKREYRMLFIGPEEMPAPPWESIYMGEEAALFQETTLEVRQAYRAFGMQAEAYQRVPDDSLALELANVNADIKDDILGHITSGTGDNAEKVVTAADAPFVGIGFILANRFKGTTTYEAYWFYKMQFTSAGLTANTRREQTQFDHETINGSGSGVTLSAGGAVQFYAYKDGLATEAAARTWLNGKAGIT